MWHFNNFQLLERHDRRKELAVRKLVRFQKPNNLGCYAQVQLTKWDCVYYISF